MRRPSGIRVLAVGLSLAVALVLPMGLGGGLATWRVLFAPVTIAYLVVGTLVMERRPGNLVGPIVFAIGAAIAAFLIVDVYVRLPGPPPGAAVLGWAVNHMDAPLFVLIGGLFLVFPTGRLPSPRWRWLAGMVVVAAPIAGLAPALEAGPLPFYPQFENPFAVTGFPGRAIGAPAYVLLVLGVAVSALALVARWRHGDPVERAQLKWIAVAASLIGLSMGTYALTFGPGVYNDVMDALVGLSFGCFAIAIGIAVLRYRLFDIDRLISRTITYGIVSAILAAAFVFVVLVLGTVLAGLAEGATLAVAGSTLVAFALFQPVRRRVQAGVDRRFDRARVDGDRTARGFGERLRERTDLDAMTGDLRATIDGALHPTAVAVWVAAARTAAGPAAEPHGVARG